MSVTCLAVLGLGYKGLYVLMISVSPLMAALLAARRKLSAQRVYLATMLTCFAALLGSRLFYLIAHPSVPIPNALGLWTLLTGNGSGSFGAYVLGTLAALCCFRLCGVGVLVGLDLLAPIMAIALILGRTGCLLSGCCYGKPTALPWGISFPPNSPAYAAQASAGIITPDSPASAPTHPVQIYEVIFVSIALFILLRKLNSKTPQGLLFLGYLGVYAMLRFVLEFVRGDTAATLAEQSLGQRLWLFMSLAALIAARKVARRNGRQPADSPKQQERMVVYEK